MPKLTINPGNLIQEAIADRLKTLVAKARFEVYAEHGTMNNGIQMISSEGTIDLAMTLMSDGRVIIYWRPQDALPDT